MKVIALLVLLLILCIPFILLVGIIKWGRDKYVGEEQVLREEQALKDGAETDFWKFLIVVMVIGTAIYLS